MLYKRMEKSEEGIEKIEGLLQRVNKNIRMAIKAEVKRMSLNREIGDVMDVMSPGMAAQPTDDQEPISLAEDSFSQGRISVSVRKNVQGGVP